MAEQTRDGRSRGGARLRLGELLLQHGVVTPDQVRAALGRQKATGHRLGKNLVQLGFVDENMLVKILATQLGIAGANLNKMEIPPEVQRLVPLEVMLDAGVLPVKLHESTLYLGMTDPTDTETLRRIALPAGVKLALVVLPQSQWEFAMDFLKRHGWGKRTLAKGGARVPSRGGSFGLRELAAEMAAHGGSGLHLSAGAPPAVRADGKLVRLELAPLTTARLEQLLLPLLGTRRRLRFAEGSEIDCAVAVEGAGRFRVSLYRVRGEIAAVLRPIPPGVPSLKELGLPPWVLSFLGRPQGLILVAGPAGHGKTTTLACLVDIVNATRHVNVVTFEELVEHVHQHQLSNVNQREVGTDTPSVAEGLRRVARLDPDVIVVDELREPEAIAAALAAAAAGRLVIAACTAPDVPGALERLVEAFPAERQPAIRWRLAAALLLVIAQRLVPRADGKGRALAYEKLSASAAARSAVRENRVGDLRRQEVGGGGEFTPFESTLAALCRRREILYEEGLRHVEDEKRYAALAGGA